MKVRVFIENYEVKFQSVQVKTGIGFLEAEITLPPGEKRRKILPGSRVNVFMTCVETDWKWVWWFRGYTVNFPMKAIGLDTNPVVLKVESELSVLKSILMSYLTVGTDDSLKDQENKVGGQVKLFRSTAEFFFPFSMISQKEIGFGHRIIGVFQALLSLNPQVWERVRQSRCLDYLVVATNDEISEKLDKAIVWGGLIHILGQLDGSFTGSDVLALMLQYTFHDITSIAPMRNLEGHHFTSPLRDTYGYMPKIEWWKIQDMGQGALAKAFCQMHTPYSKLFDHIIKPSIENEPVIKTNEIKKDQYQGAYVQEIGNTRTIMKMPHGIETKPIGFIEKTAPECLDRAYQIIQEMILLTPPGAVSKSALLAERTTGIRTNEERLCNKVISQVIQGDSRLTNILLEMGGQTSGNNTQKLEAEGKYLKQYCLFEHESSRGMNISIPNAVYNPNIIPGFCTYLYGLNSVQYTGKIVSKTDVYNLENETCSSNYELSNCDLTEPFDFNKILPDADFESLETTFEKVGIMGEGFHPVFAKLPADILKAFEETWQMVPFHRALTNIGLKETTVDGVLASEDKPPELWLVSNPKFEYMEDIVAVENFYGMLDLLPGLADNFINGYPDKSISPELWREIYVYATETMGLSDNEIVRILDGKPGNVFTFASVLIGSILPTERTSVTSGIQLLKSEYITQLPIWEGNPFPQRVDLFLHHLSRMNKEGWVDFVSKGIVSRPFKDATIPRPISDRQLIGLRKKIAEAAHGE